MLRPTLFTACLLGMIMFGAPDSAVRAAELSAQNAAIAEHHIIPGYRRLAAASQQLQQTAHAFCRQPTAEGLAALQRQYQADMDAWQAIRHIRFGPVELFLRHHRFQLWPDKRNAVGRHLGAMIAQADPKVNEASAFAQASVAVQGLSALEQLLFRQNAERLLGGPEQAYRCALALAISDNLASMSDGIVSEWSAGDPSYLQQFTHPGGANPWFGGVEEVSARLLSSLYESLTEAETLKLARPLGASAQDARPRRAESWRSERSLRNLRINIQAAKSLYNAAQQGGLSAALAVTASGKRLDQDILGRFQDIEARLRQLPGDGLKAFLRGPQRSELEQIQASLSSLRALVANELSTALGLPLGFNSLDGD